MQQLGRIQHYLTWLGLRKQRVHLQMKDGKCFEGLVTGPHYRELCRRVKELMPGAVETLQGDQS